ncbi:hybrid sensor histidine kinase/response regulator [Alsobacter soli]|uniref:Chemotaxis protein CheA n=1 Tax=Alsobacter soli TaxID=2109933 RepID=A0A2T1HQD5_9HYPH|nr:response regulator [Alsobacter soli]PSC03860.1 hybrid sensor histidine kinase/response regulator [Alsobacter soli]
MSDIRAQLLAAFDAEYRDHLAAIRRELAKAEHGEGGDIRDAFRRAHSLKGAARAVDLPAIEELAHRLEAVFNGVLDGAKLDRASMRVIELGLDAVEAFAAEVAAGGSPRHPAAALAALEDLLAGRTPQAGAEAEPASAAHDAEAAAPGAAQEPAAPSGPAPASAETLRVSAALADSLSEDMHRLFDRLRANEGVTEGLQALEAELRALSRSLTARPAGAQGRSADADLRRRVEAASRQAAALSRRQRAAATGADDQARRLRDRVDQLSLTPADSVFGGFGRMVRDLARSEGQDVEALVSGLDVQADRRVLQALKDPVMHLLRNALSHGAESPDARVAAGKPAHMTIALSFRSQGGRLVVSVRDDGRGPDLARIEAAAVERGLLPARAPHEPPPPPDQLLALVFEPQFSTAPAVDRMSGRGMGLSVAAEAARRLQGGVLLRPARPWGAEVIISAPLLATRQTLLMARVGARDFGIPTYAVERLLRLPVGALESVEGRPATRIRMGGQDITVPVVALSALVEGAGAELPAEAGFVKAMLLRRGDRRCAVAVDEFMDVRTALVGAAPALSGDGALVTGALLLDADRPAFALSPEALVERWLRDQGAGAFGVVEHAAERRDHTILVVDDSITTRTLEKSILEAQGYRVLLSVDGLDALGRLRSGEALVDLVIADVEMPRMDGFGLLQAIRTDPGLAAIPVILMTSRAAPEDVRKGLELGARAYISKQNFDQRQLLATIGQLL